MSDISIKDISKIKNFKTIDIKNLTLGDLQIKPGLNIPKGKSRDLEDLKIDLDEFIELYKTKLKRMSEGDKPQVDFEIITSTVSVNNKKTPDSSPPKKDDDVVPPAGKTKTDEKTDVPPVEASDSPKKDDDKKEEKNEAGEPIEELSDAAKAVAEVMAASKAKKDAAKAKDGIDTDAAPEGK